MRLWNLKKTETCHWWKFFLWDRSEMSGREKRNRRRQKTAAEKAEEMTSAFSKDQQQLLQPHPFPHKSRRRMMIQQLSLQPLLLQPQPLLFPQQHIRQMIQRIQEQLFPPFPNREVPQLLLQPQLLLHPHPVLHPESHPHPQSHPQLVAAKSLIDKSSSKFYLHFIIWQESVHSYKKLTVFIHYDIINEM